MLLPSYLAHKCAEFHIQRGAIPSLLGLHRVAKALRHWDAVLSGAMDNTEFIERIRGCPIFAGPACDDAIAASIQYAEEQRRARFDAVHEQQRALFRPHCWVVHENRVPSPIFVAALCGVDFFKRIDLPDAIINESQQTLQLQAVADFIEIELPHSRYCHGPFGKACFVHFRDRYDHAFIYDLALKSFNAEHHAPPPLTFAHLSLR